MLPDAEKPFIVRRLAESMGLIEPDSVRISHNKISDVTIEQVKKFYMRDDVSRQAPGLKDYVTVWGENWKERLQKQHLLLNINETFQYFPDSYPEVKLKKSKFATFRPINVLLQKDTSNDSCLCQYHENIVLICEALHKFDKSYPLYSSKFVELFVCSPSSYKCLFGFCDDCDSKIQKWCDGFMSEKLNSNISWCEWKREFVPFTSKHSRRKALSRGRHNAENKKS